MGTRTRFFDDEVLTAVTSGVTQVVIVGAGYDGRALRFRGPGVRFFEVDHPATQGDKRRRVEDLGVPLDDVTFVSIDLMEERLGDVLARAGHDPDQRSLFLCEGLLLYLSTPVVESLLGDLRARAAPASRLAVSIREERSGGSALAKARGWGRRLFLRVIGEPRRSSFGIGEFGLLLERTGWTIVREVARDGHPGERRRRLLLAAEAQ
jgi:methyltransferase (TIGR00027 family)